MNNLIVLDPKQALIDSRMRKDIVHQMHLDKILREGVDFGIIPGSSKPTLLKPGAERLCSAFHFNPNFETITATERWDGDAPLFFYRIKCSLVHIETGFVIATGIGSCNSRETKYRWRWVNRKEVDRLGLDPESLQSRSGTIREFTFAIEKAETTGKYGKPAEYWQRFRNAIADRTAVQVEAKTSTGKTFQAYEIGENMYRVPNQEPFEIINTLDKMAQKRSLVAATLIGANASEFFTQDIEDMEGFGVIDEVRPSPAGYVPPEEAAPQTDGSYDPNVGEEWENKLNAVETIQDLQLCWKDMPTQYKKILAKLKDKVKDRLLAQVPS